MAGVNKVILIGNLGADPEVRYSPDGTAVAKFNIATSDQWKDRNTGEMKKSTEWHRIVAFRRLGEICGEYLAKGKQVYIEGSLRTNQWQDKDGNKRYTTEIIASQMRMLGSRDMADNSGGSGFRKNEMPPGPEFSGSQDDDIPF